MRYCKPHNFFHPEETCPKCATRVVQEAGRLPYRATNPQEHERCTEPDGCGNLLPVCRCDLRGALGLDRPPVLYSGPPKKGGGGGLFPW